MSPTMISALLVFAAVAFAVVALALLVEWLAERRRLRNVGQQLRELTNESLDRAAARQGILKDPAAAPQFQDLALLMQQGQVSWSVQTFLLLTVGMAMAFGVLALMLSGQIIFAVPAAIFGAVLPYLYIRRKRTQRLNAFEEQLPDAIDLLGRAIRAGHPLTAGIRMVGTETVDPIASEFQRVAEEQRFGLPFDDTLMGMADRVSLVDVRILTTAILIQREVDGNLAEVLDNLAYVIRARFTIRRQLRVYTAQGRISGYVLGVLPIIVGFLIYTLNGEYMSLMFTEPLGRFLLVMAGVMQVIGFLWIRKIINIEI